MVYLTNQEGVGFCPPFTTGQVLAPPNFFTFRHHCDTYIPRFLLTYLLCRSVIFPCFASTKLPTWKLLLFSQWKNRRQSIQNGHLSPANVPLYFEPDIRFLKEQHTERRFHHTLISRIFRLTPKSKQNIKLRLFVYDHNFCQPFYYFKVKINWSRKGFHGPLPGTMFN